MGAVRLDTAFQGGTSTVPAERMAAVTPSNSVSFTYLTRGLYIGVGGDVSVNALNESGVLATCVFVGVAAGTVLPITCDRVNDTGTTATSIVALW